MKLKHILSISKPNNKKEFFEKKILPEIFLKIVFLGEKRNNE